MSLYQIMLQWMMSIRVSGVIFTSNTAAILLRIFFLRVIKMILFSHMESCTSSTVGMPEEGFKGEYIFSSFVLKTIFFLSSSSRKFPHLSIYSDVLELTSLILLTEDLEPDYRGAQM